MMKWCGWGDPNVLFPAEEKANLWPWARVKLGVDQETLIPPVARESIVLDPPRRHPAFEAELDAFAVDDDSRLLHSYGKSYPDLFRVRRGEIRRAPDLVVYPESHDEVQRIVDAAQRHGVCVIPFGGGTNIVGAINPEADDRLIVSLDMQRMNRVLSLDAESSTATIQAGARGPELEEQLRAKGFSLGHFPDSFEYSTLGGWLATRSAGMQSDAYGRIEDMVVALQCVTPSGTFRSRPTPASSAGPDLNRLFVGSEGILGVITEATMRVHRIPAKTDLRGYLFRSFEDGVDAIHETLRSGLTPSLIRLQDSNETELAFIMKSPKKGVEALVGKFLKRLLKKKGYTTPALLIIGFEGEEAPFRHARRGTLRILKKHGAFPLGARVGAAWSKDKYVIPYFRDFIMDYCCMVDVAETAAPWSEVLPLYHHTIRAAREQFERDGLKGYIGCHISHTYQTGACLYFTYCTPQKTGRELEHYYSYKRLMTETFLKNGGNLTHHHAIGVEHLPWMEREISSTGVRALKAAKASLDPDNLFNPGKLLPP